MVHKHCTRFKHIMKKVCVPRRGRHAMRCYGKKRVKVCAHFARGR